MAGDAWAIGLLWILLTVAFEFFFGHYAVGQSWRELLADYNVLRGRVWVLMLLVALVAPRWAWGVRRL